MGTGGGGQGSDGAWNRVTEISARLGCRLELPPEEGPPYIPEFYSGWEPPAADPQGRPWEDPVEKQLQHERRRRQVRLRFGGTQQGQDWEVWEGDTSPYPTPTPTPPCP